MVQFRTVKLYFNILKLPYEGFEWEAWVYCTPFVNKLSAYYPEQLSNT